MRHEPLISPVTSALVCEALHGMDGVRFDRLDVCPYCGGEIRGYDFKKKRFACVMVDDKPENIHVFVKRFHCTDCDRLSYAYSPFYPDTRMGLPVVDLCVCLGRTMPFNRVSMVLKEMNVVVDRGTIRNYANQSYYGTRNVEMFRLILPYSMINLGIMMIRRENDKPMTGTEAFSAMGYNSDEWEEFIRKIPSGGNNQIK